MNHPVFDPCDCGCEEVAYPGKADGLYIEYSCRDCGDFVGEISITAEP